MSPTLPARIASETAIAAPPRPRAPAVPFAFFGKVMEGGVATVILHDRGRVLTVRGPGPLSEDYEVEAVLEDRLVVRYVPLGEVQFVRLAAQPYAIAPLTAPEDTPQD